VVGVVVVLLVLVAVDVLVVVLVVVVVLEVTVVVVVVVVVGTSSHSPLQAQATALLKPGGGTHIWAIWLQTCCSFAPGNMKLFKKAMAAFAAVVARRRAPSPAPRKPEEEVCTASSR
jgi:hypothetical protein